MNSYYTDTDSEIEKLMLNLIKKLNRREKFRQVCDASQTIKDLTMRGIKRRFPDFDDESRKLIYVKEQYGEELAGRVKSYLEQLRG